MEQLVPVSRLQRALLAPLGGGVAECRVAIHATGIDRERAERAWAAVVTAHPLLGAAVHDTLDGPRLVLGAPGAAGPLARMRVLPATIALEIHLAVADYQAAGQIIGDLLRAYAGEPLAVPRVMPAIDPEPRPADHAFWAARLADLRRPEWPVLDGAWSPRFADLAIRTLRIPGSIWQRFVAHARHHEVGVGTACLAVVAELLHAWSRGGSVALSTLQSMRDERHHGVVGNFAAPLWLPFDRAAWTSADTFVARCRLTRSAVKTCGAHGTVHATDVLHLLAKQHGMASLPLPVVVHKSPGIAIARSPGDALDVHAIEVRAATPQTALEVEVQDFGDHALAYVSTLDTVFAPGVADALFSALDERIAALAHDPASWTGTSAIGLPPAQARVRAALATVPVTTTHTLRDLVTAAGERGDRVALIEPGARTLTYRELDRRAGAVAAGLRRTVPAGAPVAIAMQRGIDQAVAAIACTLAGLPYVPLDARWPEERLARIVAAGALAHAIVDHTFALPIAVACQPFADLVTAGAACPPAAAGPDDLAYIIYTSGTTGEPKGVAIEHRAAANTVLDVIARFGVTAADRVFAVSALAFDLSVFDLFGALAAGGACVITDEVADPARWLAACRATGVTVWSSVPAFLVALVDHIEAARTSWPPELRLVLLSGDWIPVDLPARVHALAPSVQLVSLGGATEAAIWSVYHPIARGERFARSVPYGLPLAGQRLHVLAADGAPVPDCVAGDLVIAGAGLARGYYRDPARTAAAFVDHPTLGRIYRTGDLARFRSDGVLELLGREDGQLKVQGFRIEQGEIEAAIAASVRVAACAVVARRIGSEVQLVAHVVWAAEPAEAELRGELARRLPAYMLPHLYVAHAALPLTGNGKVDRAQLRDKTPATAPPAQRSARPEARALREAWQRALGVPHVFDDDHFFRLGGTSLGALRLAAYARAAGLHVPVRWILELPVFAELWARTQQPVERLARWTERGADTVLVFVHAPRMPDASYAAIATRLPAVVDLAAWFAESPLDASREPGCTADFAGLAGKRLIVVGWSAAAIWAHACATELAAHRHGVAGLVLIDPPELAPRGVTDSEAYHLHVEAVLLQHGAAPIAHAELATRSPAAQVELAAERLTAIGRAAATVLVGDRELHVRELRGLVGYAPGACAVPALCVQPASFARSPWPADAHRTWQPHIAALDVVRVGFGDHYTMMENRAAAEIAEAIAGWLPRSTEPMFVPDRIARRTAEQPAALAVVTGTVALDYAGLAARVATAAARLAARGIRRGDTVAVWAHRSIDSIVAMLAAWHLGAVYVPIDPRAPRERIARLLELAGARGVIDLEPHATDGAPPAPLPLHADELAYVLFTSGSSGEPKPVAVGHGALATSLASIAKAHGFRPGRRVLSVAPLTFDVSLVDLAGTLATGGTIYLPPPEVLVPGEPLCDYVNAHGIDLLDLSTALLAALPTALPAGITVCVGGEECSPALAERWRDRVDLHDVYGPTEAAIAVSTHALSTPGADPTTLGRAMPPARVHVLDAELAPCPAGVAGELHIAGPTLARGYLGRPRETAARFRPDPITGGGARMYATGDRGSIALDGQLTFLGRIDRQIKIRGVRVEPAEVERVLLACRGVGGGAVIVAGDGTDRELVAVVTPAQGAAAIAAIRTELGRMLPAAMIPSHIAAVPELPRTAAGKLDRHALGRLVAPHRAAAPGDADPVTSAWRQLLHVAKLGDDAHFFALGGHSLTAARLANRLSAALAVRIPLTLVFTHPTLAAYRGAVAAVRETATAADRIAVQPGVGTLTFAQERTWFLRQLRPDSLAYNVQGLFRLRGPVQLEVLARALGEVVRRHESLRTTFADVDGTAVASVHPPAPIAVGLLDLSQLDATAAEAALEAAIDAFTRTRFALDRLPLFRFELVKLAADRWVLLQAEQHLIHDGWSLGNFVREIGEHYRAATTGCPARVPALPIQLADYARWQRARLANGELAEQRAYWRRALSPPPAELALPADFPRPSAPTEAGDAVLTTIDAALYAQVRELARRLHTTPFVVMLSAFAAWLHRATGEADLAIASGVAARAIAEAEPLIGMCLNTVVFRIAIDPRAAFTHLVEHVAEVCRMAFANQDVPFEVVVNDLGLPRKASRIPLFDVAFSYHNSAVPAIDWGEVTGEMEYRHNGSAKFDLNITCAPRRDQRDAAAGAAERVDFQWEFSTERFTRASAERLLAQYVRVTEQVVTTPAGTVGDVTLLGDAEAAALVRLPPGFRAPPFASPIQRFFATAAEYPETAAIVWNGAAWTYRTLADRVAAAALALRRAGIQPQDIVGLVLPRGFERFVGILAAAAVGAVYLPLDEAHPPARLHQLLDDARARLVLIAGAAPRGLDGWRQLDVASVPPCSALERDAFRCTPVHPLSAVYLLSTSGTTGAPKLVEAGAGNIGSILDDPRVFDVGPGDRVCHFVNYIFDASVLEIWKTFVRGATLVVPRDEELAACDLLAEHLARERITTLFTSTAVFHHMVNLRADVFAKVPTVVTGGEALAMPVARRAFAGGLRRLINIYGPTEITVYCIAREVRLDDGDAVVIGAPASGEATIAIDRANRIVPDAIWGELAVFGRGVARGYLRRPRLTAERFVPNPYGAPGERMYLTGDRGRWRSDGELELGGRLDQQIKIRGIRIEPGEVAAALRALPTIAAAHVAARRDPDGELRLVAYVVPAAPAGEAAWIAALHARLPAALIPSAWVALDRLPLNRHGKIRTADLPEPVWRSTPLPASDPTAEPPLVTALVRLAGQVLGVARVSPATDFFSAGGTSLGALQLVSQIKRHLDVELKLRDVFDAASLVELSHALISAAASAPTLAARVAAYLEAP